MLSKKKRNKNIIIALLIVSGLVLIAFNTNLFSITSFEFGFLPYGESPNSITDLNFVSFEGGLLSYSSRYWNIKQIDQAGFHWGTNARNTQLFSGNDLDLISATPQLGPGPNSHFESNPYTKTIFTSTEDFSERDFKANFIGSLDGRTCCTSGNYLGGIAFNIILEGDSGEVGILSYTYPRASNPADVNVVISPSVIDDSINIYVNGQLNNQIDYIGKYKIKIVTNSVCGRSLFHPACNVKLEIKNPSFKQQFGCTTKPDEQFYFKVFNEGSNVKIQDLNEFNKFCLSESPLQIFTNAGSTTDTQVLIDLTKGQDFNIPPGQIWVVEYIGKITDPQTACESGEAFNPDNGECLARTLITFNCPQGSSFSDGVCIVETEPIVYQTASIETHQSLQQDGKFRYTHILDSQTEETSTSFNVLNSQFSSQGIFYNGSGLRVNYPEDKENWFAKFSYLGNDYKISLNEKIDIGNHLFVKLTSIEGRLNHGIVKDFKAEYTFSIDTSFINISYSDKKIKVTNSFQTLDGGITLTTEDNVGTTKVKTIDKSLQGGNTIFSINTDNLVKIKARPFIKINTPDFNYIIDTEKALVVSDLENPNTSPTVIVTKDIPNFFSNLNKQQILIIVLSLSVIIFLTIRLKKRRKR